MEVVRLYNKATNEYKRAEALITKEIGRQYCSADVKKALGAIKLAEVDIDKNRGKMMPYIHAFLNYPMDLLNIKPAYTVPLTANISATEIAHGEVSVEGK